MSKFDTHGGYFAPKDYLKVNEGGSHEENPNGGVQIGVDPEGNPNLLEEGEPVYKDYVYSDNITAEKEFLEQNHLPGKYDGKLYSKIADDILSEAEERPLDPISRNGLEALLGRLAEAQEGQKQRDQQKQLEDELSNLSPEELDQLEAMLSEGEQPIVGEDMYAGSELDGPDGEQGPAGPTFQLPYATQPMMANGGFLRMFDGGGPRKKYDELASEILSEMRNNGRASGIGNTDLPLVDEHPEMDVALMATQPGGIVTKLMAPKIYRGMVNGIVNGEDPVQLLMPFAKIGKVISAAEAAEITGKIADYGKDIDLATKELEKLKSNLSAVKKGGPGSRDVIQSGIDKANERIRFAKREMSRLKSQLPKSTNVSEPAKGSSVAEETKKEAEDIVNKRSVAGHAVRTMYDPTYVGRQIWKSLPESGWRYPATVAGGLVGGIPATAFWGGLGKGVNGLIDAYSTPQGVSSAELTPYTGYYSDQQSDEYDFDDEPTGALRAYGGRINRFDGGGWADFFKLLEAYQGSMGKSNLSGKYAIDRNAEYWKNRSARDIEAIQAYKDFTDYIKSHSDDPNVLKYFSYLDKGINRETGAKTLLNEDGALADDWLSTFDYRRNDGDLGIYHLSPEDIGFLTAPAESVVPAQNPQNGLVTIPVGGLRGMNTGMIYDWTRTNPTGTSYVSKEDNPTLFPGVNLTWNGLSVDGSSPTSPVKADADEDEYEMQPMPVLPTWPRYSGAVGAGLLGLYNAFQEPDRYTQRRMNPQLPEGRIHMQNQVYNPLDQNMIANSIIAQGNATNRALRNSGLGPSTASAVLSSDNNISGNLGTGFLQTWDANNQRRNAVIAANNQVEAQRANFDWTVDAARKQILNDVAYRNAYNDLLLQRLNYAAEGDKYQAVGNQIANGLQALSGIGRENFAMNQINTNPAFLGYGVGANGVNYYLNPYMKDKKK